MKIAFAQLNTTVLFPLNKIDGPTNSHEVLLSDFIFYLITWLAPLKAVYCSTERLALDVEMIVFVMLSKNFCRCQWSKK